MTARELGEMPAYPVAAEGGSDSGLNPCFAWGLNKLEAFTMAAMQGILSGPMVNSIRSDKNTDPIEKDQWLAMSAVDIAKATLEALAREMEGK